MASGPITSWQIDGETGPDYFLVSKITSGGDCGHEIKRKLIWKKSYDQPRQHIKKHRHYFANKGLPCQSYGFSSSQYGCESWTIKRLSTEELMVLNCIVGEDS